MTRARRFRFRALQKTIGSVDPDALKIPARRAECSLTENARSPFHAEPGHYPLGTSTSDPDLNLTQVVGRAPIDENYGSMRLDYRINNAYSLTTRYFRDAGEARTPL